MILLGAGAWFWFRSRQQQFRWDLFEQTFAQLDPIWFAASVAAVLLSYVGRVLRWQLMIRPLKARTSFWGMFRATAIGFTAVVFFGRAGELVRPYLISKRENLAFSSQMAVWLLERIYDLLMVLLLFAFALSRIHSSSTTIGGSLRWLLQAGGHTVGLLCTVCLAMLIAFGLFPGYVESRLSSALSVLPDPLQAKLDPLLKAFLAGTRSTQRRSFVLLVVGYTFAEWMVIVASFLFLFKSFPATASFGFMDTLIVAGVVAFGSAIQIPGIGGGMQIATVLVLTEFFRLPLETATGIALILWAVAFLVIIPIGMLLAFQEGLRWRKLIDAEELQRS
ncbi:MAG: flippase-like domain-containing protein [Bryobacteraceae bacterium]|nr:flippase-like domain-containing protein [Bryobacteraceae bacterium]MDW8377336.1 lysylphosphatidylglycerol synthase transmembrane domain-containing protein [Bryobacterales bacterium]